MTGREMQQLLHFHRSQFAREGQVLADSVEKPGTGMAIMAAASDLARDDLPNLPPSVQMTGTC
jgi:hypothetical protein